VPCPEQVEIVIGLPSHSPHRRQRADRRRWRGKAFHEGCELQEDRCSACTVVGSEDRLVAAALVLVRARRGGGYPSVSAGECVTEHLV